jgi:ribonuclease Z
MLAVTILGNNSAIPAHGRHPTAQVITTSEDLLLFDCGEGTQIQIMNYKIKRSRINHIFISHLHGDHYFGLIGLLSSFALLGRIQPLHVYGPVQLESLIKHQFELSDTYLPYPLTFHAIREDGLLLDTRHYTVSCFSTVHRIECRGFIVREKRKQRKVLPEKATANGIPYSFFPRLQEGEDFITAEGLQIPNDLVTTAGENPRAYAFAADTLFEPGLADRFKGVDLLYHEATYPASLSEKAAERFHSTSVQAAEMAQKAEVKRLLIGHFSAKFENIDEFETEAKTVFPNTMAAREGVTYLV